MSFVSPAVEHVAKKIARTPGVEASYIGKDGAVDAVLETAFDRVTRQRVLDIGRRALVPVRVFYNMPDGETIGEAEIKKFESLEDYYTQVHVAGFAGAVSKAPPEEVAGDAYGTKDVKAHKDARDSSGQLKLSRIRSTTRGRPVIGWKYGSNALRVGDKVKFKKACCLQMALGQTINVGAGATASVSQMSSRRPIAYLSLGDSEKVELPIHAAGHVYDVMVDPRLESVQQEAVNNKLGYMTPELKRLVMTVGFGRNTVADETPTNTPNSSSRIPDLHKYSAPEEDMLVPAVKGADSDPSDNRDDDRSSHVTQKEPKVLVRKKGKLKQKTALFSKKR